MYRYLNEIHVASIKRHSIMILFVQNRKIVIWNMLYCPFGGNTFCKLSSFENDVAVSFFHSVLRLQKEDQILRNCHSKRGVTCNKKIINITAFLITCIFWNSCMENQRIVWDFFGGGVLVLFCFVFFLRGGVGANHNTMSSQTVYRN